MKKIFVVSGCLALFCMIFFLPKQSLAVPSFARQLQKPCTACHTIWPNLNQYGRQFKVKAYTDVSPEWQMITKDRLNLMYIFPVSARAIFLPYTHEVDKVTRINTNTTELNSVALFVASRVFDYGGVFGSAEWAPDTGTFSLPTAKVAFQYPLSKGNTLGLVAFKGLSAAADPFNSLGGRDRPLTFGDETIPWILRKGWTFNFWSEENRGVVLHGYFLGNRLYAGAGAMRGGDAGDVANTTFANDKAADPIDGYFRLGWDQKLPNGAVTLGGSWYSGRQRVSLAPFTLASAFKTRANRAYGDASLEQNFGEDHLVELQALYGWGKETNAFGGRETRKFEGFFAEGSYFFQRTIGVVAAYNFMKASNVLATDFDPSRRKHVWVGSLDYLPWLNTKVALQYVNTRSKFVSNVRPNDTDNIFKIVFDVVF